MSTLTTGHVNSQNVSMNYTCIVFENVSNCVNILHIELYFFSGNLLLTTELKT